MAPIRYRGGPRPWSWSIFSGSSFRSAAVLESAPLLGRPNSVSSKHTTDFSRISEDGFLFFEFLGQMVVVEPLVLSQVFYESADALMPHCWDEFARISTNTVNNPVHNQLTRENARRSEPIAQKSNTESAKLFLTCLNVPGKYKDLACAVRA